MKVNMRFVNNIDINNTHVKMVDETREERVEKIRQAVRTLKDRGATLDELVEKTGSTISAIRTLLNGGTPDRNNLAGLDRWAVEAGVLSPPPPIPERRKLKSKMEIAVLIAGIRKRSGLDQTDFAARIGFGDQSEVSRWENGRSVPGEAALTAIAAIEGETIDIFQRPKGMVRESRARYGVDWPGEPDDLVDDLERILTTWVPRDMRTAVRQGSDRQLVKAIRLSFENNSKVPERDRDIIIGAIDRILNATPPEH